jgi:hypothetical protein
MAALVMLHAQYNVMVVLVIQYLESAARDACLDTTGQSAI